MGAAVEAQARVQRRDAGGTGDLGTNEVKTKGTIHGGPHVTEKKTNFRFTRIQLTRRTGGND